MLACVMDCIGFSTGEHGKIEAGCVRVLTDIGCVTATDYVWLEQELTVIVPYCRWALVPGWAFKIHFVEQALVCSNCTNYVVGEKNKSPVQRFVVLLCKLVLTPLFQILTGKWENTG